MAWVPVEPPRVLWPPLGYVPEMRVGEASAQICLRRGPQVHGRLPPPANPARVTLRPASISNLPQTRSGRKGVPSSGDGGPPSGFLQERGEMGVRRPAECWVPAGSASVQGQANCSTRCFSTMLSGRGERHGRAGGGAPLMCLSGDRSDLLSPGPLGSLSDGGPQGHSKYLPVPNPSFVDGCPGSPWGLCAPKRTLELAGVTSKGQWPLPLCLPELRQSQ